MANTTEMLLTHFDEQDIIDFINNKCHVNFRASEPIRPMYIGERCLTLTSHGFCVRCIDEEVILRIIDAFNTAAWVHPEYVTLVVLDDNSEQYNGVHVLPTNYKLTNLGE